jgi:hypothetical protein
VKWFSVGQMMQQTIVVIGNGPSLRGFDLKTLSKVDTLGMNAAYRFWDRIDWYPTHYCCLDSELIATHHKEIYRLVQGGYVKTAFLNGRFLDFYPETAWDDRYVFFDQFSSYWYEKRGRNLGLSFTESPAFISSQPSKVTTGSYSVRYAIHIGYKRIGLIGIDLQYVEKIPEAQNTDGIQLVIKETPAHNPNYFFDDYQQAGDRFQVPNPSVHKFDLHPASFEAIRDDLIYQNLNVEVVNCNTQSELHARGVFPFVPLWRFIGEAGLGALVVPTQVRERDRILKNLRLWKHPAFAPFLHFRGRDRVKLIFSFTGNENGKLKQEILEEFQKGDILQQYFSDIQFYFFALPKDEDIYIQDYSLPAGKKGYKSGPNQQFFLNLDALQNVCQYAFFMETDCLPIRPDWLGKLYDLVQTSEEFWILGSSYKGRATIARHYARHINGNAVYAVGNSKFAEFAQTWKFILDETIEKHDNRIAYDCVLENFFAHEFGFNPDAPLLTVNPNATRWKLYQEVVPYLRYSNYVLNYSGKVDLEQAKLDFLREVREASRESYILHNRKVCDIIYDQVLKQENVQTQEQKISSQNTAPIHKLTTREPILDFCFTGEFLRGGAYTKDNVYTVGYGSGQNYVAFQYSTKVKPNSSIRAIVTLYVYEACSLTIALYRNGQTSFEGEKQVFNCKGGVESFTIQARFAHEHTGIRIQIGCDEPREIQFGWVDATLS